MIFFSVPTGDPTVHAAMAAGELAFIDTPHQRNHRPPGTHWCADNGCFSEYRFNEDHWFGWLRENAYDAAHCAFAAAPDVLGDAAATFARSMPWLPRIRALGFRAAYVAQDGIEHSLIPWCCFDVLFIGGTDDFKLGPVARVLITEARRRGMWVHMGRINGGRRWRYADAMGCDSVDGTYLKHGPSVLLPNVMRWRSQLSMFGDVR